MDLDTPLQKALDVDGYNSEDMRIGRGCTPRLTENTKKDAANKENQERNSSPDLSSKFCPFSDINRMVENMTKLKPEQMADTKYIVLLFTLIRRDVSVIPATILITPVMIAEVYADFEISQESVASLS